MHLTGRSLRSSVIGMPQDRPTDADVAPEAGYTVDGVPTFESVREKIETRYATSIGSVELAAETPEGRSAEDSYEARQKAAAERLAQIRASMGKDGNVQENSP